MRHQTVIHEFAGTSEPSRHFPIMTRLLALITALSLVDLLVTLVYMKTSGMYEANPIVHSLAGLGSPVLSISLFKIASVAIGVGLLHWLRQFASARFAAALMVLVLTGLSAQWARYGAEVAATGLAGEFSEDYGWIRLD